MALKIPSVTLSRKAKIILGAAIVLLFAGGIVFLSIYSSKALFTENPRFILKNIVVKSSGWWSGKEYYVMQKLDLKKGSTVLFTLDLEQLRTKLEKESSIHNVVVARRLPDTLMISITERIPRAVLRDSKSSLLLDSECIVMQKEKSLNITESLPVIVGFRDSVPAFGKKFSALQPAMELVMLAATDFPELQILQINAKAEDHLVFSMYYKNSKNVVYRVWIPVNKMDLHLNALISSMPDVLVGRAGKGIVDIDLRYAGKVTLK